MKRREAIKLGALTLLATAAGATVGCDKKTIITYASTAVSFLEQTLPFFRDLVPASVAILDKAILVAKELQTALQQNSASAIDFIQQLIEPEGLFQKILTDVGLITDPAKRKIVSGILAIAGVALNIIAASLHQGTPPAIAKKAREQNMRGVAAVESAATKDTLEKALAALKN